MIFINFLYVLLIIDVFFRGDFVKGRWGKSSLYTFLILCLLASFIGVVGLINEISLSVVRFCFFIFIGGLFFRIYIFVIFMELYLKVFCGLGRVLLVVIFYLYDIM